MLRGIRTRCWSKSVLEEKGLLTKRLSTTSIYRYEQMMMVLVVILLDTQEDDLKFLNIKRSLSEKADDHEQFYGELEQAPDHGKWEIVADFFGKGILNGANK